MILFPNLIYFEICISSSYEVYLAHHMNFIMFLYICFFNQSYIISNLTVIRTIRKSGKIFSKNSSAETGSASAIHGKDIKERASRSLVQLTLALGVTFIICAAFANFVVLLLATKIIKLPEYFHEMEHLAILTENLTMILNPILYTIFLPSLRRQIWSLCFK